MPTIDNIPQAKWLATAPPDDVMIARFTKIFKLAVYETSDGGVTSIDSWVHYYFDTGTDMLYSYTERSDRWLCTDPNRKGVFA